MDIYRSFLKRLIDIVLSLLFIVFFFPCFLVILIILCVTTRCKPFFFQERLGYQNRVFRLIKFRKLKDGVDVRRKHTKEDLTKFGSFLVKTSLDELPQFINILLGQMSFIGPRPLLSIYYPYYTPRELKRHNVRPGLTGWAQVHGRQFVKWEERFDYDLFYVDNLSFWLDVKILYLTVKYFIKPPEIERKGKQLPRLFRYRAFIRMPWHRDDVVSLKALFSKGETQVLAREFDMVKDVLLQRHNNDFFVLIDDYQHRYNSFVYVKITGQTAKIVDYYISDTCFLPPGQMRQKYRQMIEKYLLDMGHGHCKLEWD